MGGTEEPQPVPMAQQKRRGFMPPEVTELLSPAFKVGLWSGSAGVVAGIGGSIATETSAVLGGTMTGISWFTLGGTYWLTRTATAKAWGGEEQMKPLEKIGISALSGTTAGAMSGLLRGPTRIIPGMGFWTVMGAGGQLIANQIITSRANRREDSGGWLDSKWSLMTKLSDEDYINKMKEQILAVDADIALIDDRIAALRAGEQTGSAVGTKDL